MGKPPRICHQHLRDSSTSQGIAHVGGDRHFTAVPSHRASPIIPGRHRNTPRCLPSPGKLNFVIRWSFAAGSRAGALGQPSFFHLQRAGGGQGQRSGGQRALPTHTPHLQMPARFPGCWQSKADLPPAPCPPQLQAPSREGPWAGAGHPPAGGGRAPQLSTPAPVGNGRWGCENSEFPPPSDLLPSTARS